MATIDVMISEEEMKAINKGNVIKFDVSSIISTHAIIEDLVFIPFCKQCMELKEDIMYEWQKIRLFFSKK